jgi:hypothetical protein
MTDHKYPFGIRGSRAAVTISDASPLWWYIVKIFTGPSRASVKILRKSGSPLSRKTLLAGSTRRQPLRTGRLIYSETGTQGHSFIRSGIPLLSLPTIYLEPKIGVGVGRRQRKEHDQKMGTGRCPAVSSEDVMGYARADRRYNERQSGLFPIKIPREKQKGPDTTVGICRRCAE